MVAVVGARGRINLAVVSNQFGVELVGFSLQEAVVAVEAIDVRTILHRFGKVDVLPFAFLFVYAGPVPAQMPLSDHS